MEPVLDLETYKLERAICDKANAYMEKVMCEGGTVRKRNHLTVTECAHPDYEACSNEMRGRVEQFELLTDTPECFGAYLGNPEAGRFPVQVWTGHAIGKARKGSSWRVNSHWGSHMHQFYAVVQGREFTGRGFGEGMVIVLRETAASKRKREGSSNGN